MKWIKKIFLNPISLFFYFAYLVLTYESYSQKRDWTQQVVLYQEATGDLYTGQLGSPEYYSKLTYVNLFDSGEVFDTKSYDIHYLKRIGNLKVDKIDEDIPPMPTVKLYPTRKIHEYNKLPDSIKNQVVPEDAHDVEIKGAESQGLKSFTMILSGSNDRFRKFVKDRSDQYEAKNKKNDQ
jgi:hypothetical protein